MTGKNLATPAELERALFDPGSMFASPREVVDHEGLSAQQKIEILRRWEYDAAEQSVAVEEGMAGEENDQLQQILLALAQVPDGVSVERVGPSKQHGLQESRNRKRE